MKHLDLQVIQQGLKWLDAGAPVWLCTVMATFGSAPREPGSMLAVVAGGESCGSLSGGCVEEDFLERLARGEFSSGNQIIRYGEGGLAPTLALPCGGVLDVLVEPFASDSRSLEHFKALEKALLGQRSVRRNVQLGGLSRELSDAVSTGPKVTVNEKEAVIAVGPVKRLVIAGLSPVAEYCAQFALALGFEVIICDPRPEHMARAAEVLPGVRLYEALPAVFIAEGGCHAATAVVALTHDPRIDDLTLMEAVRTDAFYIGAMGSVRTSTKRMERLARIAQLDMAARQRIHAPIGLRLGSKTPAEIALSVMADVLRVGNGIEIGAL